MQPLGQNFSQCWQIQQEVLSFNELWGFAVDFGNRVDQVDRVELVTAVVALIAASTISVTNRAFALNVAVRQRATSRWRDCTLHGFFNHVAVVVQALEKLLGNGVMVARCGAGKHVIGQAQTS